MCTVGRTGVCQSFDCSIAGGGGGRTRNSNSYNSISSREQGSEVLVVKVIEKDPESNHVTYRSGSKLELE